MSWKRYSEFRWWELEFRKWHRILVYSSIDGRCYNDKCWWKNRGWTRERHIKSSWGVGGWMGALLCAKWAHFDWVVKGGCPKSFSTREIQVYKVSREILQTKNKLSHSRPSCETLESMASMAIYGSYRFLSRQTVVNIKSPHIYLQSFKIFWIVTLIGSFRISIAIFRNIQHMCENFIFKPNVKQ